jgi:DNA-binding ferritin-like protein
MSLSKETLQLCDWLIDGVTLAANHPDFENQARIIATAKREVQEAFVEAGGTPIAVLRAQEEQSKE